MVDPESVYDKLGEWIEVYNPTSDWIQVDGLVLADANIDAWTLEPFEGKPVVAPPKDFVLLCAESDCFDNGGVDCHATFKYDSLGKGVAMSNSGDEVILHTKADTTIDRVNYGSSFSEGSSLGVDDRHGIRKQQLIQLV